ncbi:GATA transcription factor 4-like [Momordica charantia]|uniref:GATA transcription factor 4-like n=1 Tax=Momordica charantia TaxID=3673 RepID=A0A6J1DH53_MOMCH|nr:GATA transcription factor 4-like [Momordica charantia]
MPQTFRICTYAPPLPSQKPHSTPTLLPHPRSPVTQITLNYVYSTSMEVPEYLDGGYYGTGAGQFSPEMQKSAADHFAVDEYLLDFSNEDVAMTSGFFDNVAGNSSDSSTVTAVESCNSSVSGGDNRLSGNFGSGSLCEAQFSSELCIPCDDLAELEWLSNFVEDSFSTEEIDKNLHAVRFPPTTSSSVHGSAKTTSFFQDEALALPGKARSKRSRASPCDWSTRLLHMAAPAKTKGESSNAETSCRKCLHCAAEKTPQWRTGPMGPKTLCNACGVRYKSGRLVPEYRPAASPTFVSTKHSNSHRKVMELRRQKEEQFLSESSIFGRSNGCNEFLIHRRNGGDFSHMM